MIPGRREFTKAGLGMSGYILTNPLSLGKLSSKSEDQDLSLHVFSKHLQFLDYAGMAEAAAEIGFDGVDLTVRPKGHVLPEEAEDKLPEAVAEIRKAGLKADMMASGVNSVEDPVNRKVLETAASEDIRYYRLAYLSFEEEKSIPRSLEDHNTDMQKLAAFNKSLGISGTYQNHAGKRIGGEIWDIYHLLEGIPASDLGCQYDIRHAMVEGGTSWENGLKLIHENINTLVLKDFIWKKVDGKWKVVNVPLGQGMVDFASYFKLLKNYQIQVPVSIHYEYDLGGVEHGARTITGMTQKDVFDAMKRDLQFARNLWRET